MQIYREMERDIQWKDRMAAVDSMGGNAENGIGRGS